MVRRINTNNTLDKTYPELIKEWDYTKNGNLRPEDFTYGSHRKVWWKCDQGHSWDAIIKNRTLNSYGCSV
jgi:hypothetical protein